MLVAVKSRKQTSLSRFPLQARKGVETALSNRAEGLPGGLDERPNQLRIFLAG